jgi:hypothetical protein
MSEKLTYGKMLEGGTPAVLDIEALISSRLLIQANSGGGKSYLLRKLVEESFGKVPIILFDLEGEFATLREKHDFVLIGNTADGADVQISIKTAQLLPRRLVELGASAILDMSELKAHERHLFVKRFCEAMLNLPKELWSPVLVILDEIHVFCPQKEKSEASAAVIDLFTRGRKRGICGVGATQRISKFQKDAAAECNNKLIGRCVLDVDMKRAAEELGFTTKEDVRSLRELKPGEFYAFGPALHYGVNKIKVSDVKTTHPKVGARILARTTPQPEKVKSILGKLTDLQGEAEKKEKTEAELKHEIASLRGQLLAAQRHTPAAPAQPKAVQSTVDLSSEMAAIENAVREMRRKSKQKGHVGAGKVTEAIGQLVKRDPSAISESEPQKLRAGAMRMLEAVASFAPQPVTKQQLGTLVGMVFTGGTFNTYLQELKRNEWIDESRDGFIVTPSGLAAAGDFKPISRKPEDLLDMWADKFRSGAAKMLREIASRYPNAITKDELGEVLGMVFTGGTFNTYLQELKRAGLIEADSAGGVTATKELFPDGGRK